MTAWNQYLPQTPTTSSNGDVVWCRMPGALISQKGVVWLRESAHADRQDLVKRILSGEYSKPFVIDDGETRRLHFSLKHVQSEMRLDEPYALVYPHTQKMMTFLLFLPEPQHVVIVGLGGGSLTKFCWRQLTRTCVTTVEVDQDVIDFGELFELPPPDARMRIVHADARDYFAQANAPADVILLDGCDKLGTAPEFCDELFYQNLRARLRPQGILVANMAGPRSSQHAHRRLIADTFEDRVILVDVRFCSNRLAFAFNDTRDFPNWWWAIHRADMLTQQHGLDFHTFAELLQRGYRRRKFQPNDGTERTAR